VENFVYILIEQHPYSDSMEILKVSEKLTRVRRLKKKLEKSIGAMEYSPYRIEKMELT
jgi:hypothetical protein